ncbi:MAG TPA: SH3 domain-containing protein [Rhizomicrobium sp.]|nr:SH3 domain-containing protein [Rhizomicrobium sp.]
MESGSGQVPAGAVDKKSRDEYVDIPSYVEPVVGLSNREKLLYHGSGIGVGLLIAALAFAGWRYFHPDHTVPSSMPQQIVSNAPVDASVPRVADNEASPAATDETAAPRVHHAKANAGADVIAAAKPAAGLMYVHRNNSDLRPAPSTSSDPIRKLPKGEKVQLLMLSDKWAQVDDAGTKGWMRASVLKDTPPGAKKARKKKSNDE